MDRKKLEALVWRHKHPDARGEALGFREILRLVPGSGTCAVPLSSLSRGELVDALPGKVRLEHGLELWRVVVSAGDVVLGVFGSGLYSEAEACAARATRQTGIAASVRLWSGPKPRVGDRAPVELEARQGAA